MEDKDWQPKKGVIRKQIDNHREDKPAEHMQAIRDMSTKIKDRVYETLSGNEDHFLEKVPWAISREDYDGLPLVQGFSRNALRPQHLKETIWVQPLLMANIRKVYTKKASPVAKRMKVTLEDLVKVGKSFFCWCDEDDIKPFAHWVSHRCHLTTLSPLRPSICMVFIVRRLRSSFASVCG